MERIIPMSWTKEVKYLSSSCQRSADEEGLHRESMVLLEKLVEMEDVLKLEKRLKFLFLIQVYWYGRPRV
ncbi:unnamed protein product [Sphenostylis stenocarpa]|uniref:Uncharacterized protein n=1 Tax=Sphenostylis stenocarpa TaxID=92480 RepID=A0AA86VX10_9FABA|nr:unnamed protein product [Sphenostylis stenocarpa]